MYGPTPILYGPTPILYGPTPIPGPTPTPILRPRSFPTVANKLGCKVITLTGMKPDNAARKLGWLNAFLPAPTYGLAETSHAAILHHWMDRMTIDPA